MRHQKKEVIKSSVLSVTIYCSYVALAFSFFVSKFFLWLEPGVQDTKRKPSQKLVDPKWVVPTVPQQSLWEAVLPWRVLERS